MLDPENRVQSSTASAQDDQAKAEMERQYQRGLDIVRSIRGFDSEGFVTMIEAIQKRRK